MSHYSPIFTDVSNNVLKRWQCIRTFIERWYELEIPDIDCTTDIQKAEAELGLELPQSFKHYLTLSQQLLETRYGNGQTTSLYSRLFRDNFGLRHLQEYQAISLMFSYNEADNPPTVDSYWAVKIADLSLEDPPVHGYVFDSYNDRGEQNFFHIGDGKMYSSLSSFTLAQLFSFLRSSESNNGSGFGILIEKTQNLPELLGNSFQNHTPIDELDISEGEDIFAHLDKAPFSPDYYLLAVHLRQKFDQKKIPETLWNMSKKAVWMYGIFTP